MSDIEINANKKSKYKAMILNNPSISEDDFVSCVRVVEYGDSNIEVIDPDEIVITESDITIVFSYPLSVEVDMKFTSKGGFSRMELFKCIHKAYKEIYDTEHKMVGDPGHIPGMLNRSKSAGPFGIWGHDISDLYIEGIKYKDEDQKYHLIMGS